MVIREAQRSFTYLNIYDFNVDAVIVNRVIPETVTDAYFEGWKDIQRKYRADIIDSFSPIPIYYAPLFETEVVGMAMLGRMGEAVFDSEAPEAIKFSGRSQSVEKNGDAYILTIDMPFVEKSELSLNQKGDELIVRAGTIKRNITLPRTLLNYAITQAKFEDNRLKIRFGGAAHE
jgi:arsenite-transporting ATPase